MSTWPSQDYRFNHKLQKVFDIWGAKRSETGYSAGRMSYFFRSFYSRYWIGIRTLAIALFLPNRCTKKYSLSPGKTPKLAKQNFSQFSCCNFQFSGLESVTLSKFIWRETPTSSQPQRKFSESKNSFAMKVFSNHPKVEKLWLDQFSKESSLLLINNSRPSLLDGFSKKHLTVVYS